MFTDKNATYTGTAYGGGFCQNMHFFVVIFITYTDKKTQIRNGDPHLKLIQVMEIFQNFSLKVSEMSI